MLIRYFFRLAVLSYESGRIESTVNPVLLFFIEMMKVQNVARDALRKDEACASADRMEVSGTRMPDEIIQEIFCRLPFPEIVKVGEVSKVWNKFYLNELKPKLPEMKPVVNEATPVSSWAKYCPYLSENQLESKSFFTWVKYYPHIYENQLEYDPDL